MSYWDERAARIRVMLTFRLCRDPQCAICHGLPDDPAVAGVHAAKGMHCSRCGGDGHNRATCGRQPKEAHADKDV